MADFNFLLATRLSQDQQQVLEILQGVCRRSGLNLYLTGGPMRDLLIGQPVRFLHFTTEGSPLGLAAALQAVGAEHISPHPAQGSINLTLRGVRLRLEAAQGPNGAGTIIEDLRRRGLTINSIGLSLNPGSRGLPLDPTNGAADIEARLLRISHPYVYLEDPIVLLRTVRLATRLDFSIEERTRARMESAQEGDYLARATASARGQEFEAIAYEPDPASVLRALEKEGWLAATFGAGVKTAKMNLGALARLAPAIEAWEHLGLHVDAGLAAMPLMLGGLAAADQTRLAQMLPSRHLGSEWKKIRSEAQQFEKRLLAAGASASQWLQRAQEAVERTLAEAAVYASLEPDNPKAGKKLKEFQAAASQIRQRLPLGVLRAAGMAPHSLQAEAILRPWYRRLLNGEALTDAELAEGLRKTVAPVNPAAPKPTPASKKEFAKLKRPAAPPPKPAAPAAAKAAAQAAPAKPMAKAKAKAKGVAKRAARPVMKNAAKAKRKK
ncbi:MAG: hypothetical protein ACRD1E_13380 [Terriglobales bacterium]